MHNNKNIKHRFLPAFIVSSIVGMIIGRKLCARVPARALQVGFASICVVVAAYMLIKASV